MSGSVRTGQPLEFPTHTVAASTIAFDAHPSTGALPPGAPAVCEEFRKQPDARERAADIDALYGRNPNLAALPR